MRCATNAIRMRQDVTVLQKRAKDARAEAHASSEHMVIRLEDKAAREAASAADKDALLGRRQQEIAKLKEQLKAANAELAQGANRALRDAGPRPIGRLPISAAEATERKR